MVGNNSFIVIRSNLPNLVNFYSTPGIGISVMLSFSLKLYNNDVWMTC